MEIIKPYINNYFMNELIKTLSFKDKTEYFIETKIKDLIKSSTFSNKNYPFETTTSPEDNSQDTNGIFK